MKSAIIILLCISYFILGWMASEANSNCAVKPNHAVCEIKRAFNE